VVVAGKVVAKLATTAVDGKITREIRKLNKQSNFGA